MPLRDDTRQKKIAKNVKLYYTKIRYSEKEAYPNTIYIFNMNKC